MIDKQDQPRLFCCAVWSTPDSDFQVEHFGRVILQGPELAEYVIWRKGLTEQEGEVWDRLVSGLRPDQNLDEKIQAFEFSDSPRLAEPARRVILNGLKNTLTAEAGEEE